MERKLLHIEKSIPQNILDRILYLQTLLVPNNIRLSQHLRGHLEGGDHKHDYTKEELLWVIGNLQAEPQLPFEVEVEVDDTEIKIKKYVVRTSLDDEYDISIVLRGSMIITAWINLKEDIHKTLELSKYDIL